MLRVRYPKGKNLFFNFLDMVKISGLAKPLSKEQQPKNKTIFQLEHKYKENKRLFFIIYN